MNYQSLICDPLITSALAEDLGGRGDITSALVLPKEIMATAVMRARTQGVAAGLDIAQRTFELCGAQTTQKVQNGAHITTGQDLMCVTGRAHAILAAERVALNFAAHLSGIATATAAMVEAVHGTNARIVSTRKTTPGLRALEKAAVVAGGGGNHRFGLYDAILIKDNHIALAGGVQKALERARAGAGHMLKIAIEVDTLVQLKEVLATQNADSVLLDNMDLEDIRAAMALAKGRIVTEYSGGVRLENVRAIAQTGVDYISVGWLTHSAPALDLGLDIA